MILVITAEVRECHADANMVTTSIHFQDKLSLPSLKLNLPEGVGEGDLFVNNKALTLAELNGESPCLLSTVEAEKKIEPEAQAAAEKVGPEIVEVNHYHRTDTENEIQHVNLSFQNPEPKARAPKVRKVRCRKCKTCKRKDCRKCAACKDKIKVCLQNYILLLLSTRWPICSQTSLR